MWGPSHFIDTEGSSHCMYLLQVGMLLVHLVFHNYGPEGDMYVVCVVLEDLVPKLAQQ